MQERPEPTQVKPLSGAPTYGRLLALPTSLPERLGWKDPQGTNTHKHFLLMDFKSFII
jgi:hypothetical protein